MKFKIEVVCFALKAGITVINLNGAKRHGGNLIPF